VSRPQNLADHDLTFHIVEGIRKHEPAVMIIAAREVAMHQQPDANVLEFAASRGLIVISHDRQTMTKAAYDRVRAKQPFPGLFIAKQKVPVGPIINELILRWAASEAEEWFDRVEYI
jgi:hypothetical protein